jgi:hypothetical protein
MLRPILVVVALALAYWFGLRRWFARWGATDADLARTMAGDAVIAAPTHVQTQAVTIDAPPAAVWPWLVQIGHGRGGRYSDDWLDRVFHRRLAVHARNGAGRVPDDAADAPGRQGAGRAPPGARECRADRGPPAGGVVPWASRRRRPAHRPWTSSPRSSPCSW